MGMDLTFKNVFALFSLHKTIYPHLQQKNQYNINLYAHIYLHSAWVFLIFYKNKIYKTTQSQPPLTTY